MHAPLTDLPAEFQRFQNLHFIASGGQKIVFRGTCPQHGAIVLKVFNPGTDMARFERELSAVQRIQCPLTPTILESGMTRQGGQPIPYVVESFIPGASIQQHLDAGSLQDPNVVRLATDILQVLTLTEQRGIVHRDIKPANLLLHADTGAIWLLDFGIARHLDRTALTVGPIGPCTAGFAPPEQFNALAAEVDVRSDLFALGVTLHTCIEGRNFYCEGARDHVEVFQRVQSVPLPRLTREPCGVAGFADLVMALTQIRRSHRPHSAAEARDWLAELLVQYQA
ncbi:non-specific serine/threonine protein kinase [Cupriavidus necator]|uniref:Serine/threonine protein kinase n=1 Tax=Cupriavidus necator (strain ATCC 17699 / DSM 428 / KCTC 22496 / NCIMB 10442 / H16 / Stanier 337) TaxID=381666 RepID=Q0KD90_CUPNH|nr:serine/threonine-protein kinase [Cupriavidus necator]QCB99949.1 serine/threonine protein kinase [Cupriavidus necator H16]QQB77235.1 serine/threonine protein kinase [Cupriavidus necator]WKA41799.1 serine/threonine-protein kinase [Cupriavidus necator]CAJ92031.1 conserved hypothetical protein [Cupriavidus necator H16]